MFRYITRDASLLQVEQSFSKSLGEQLCEVAKKKRKIHSRQGLTDSANDNCIVFDNLYSDSYSISYSEELSA